MGLPTNGWKNKSGTADRACSCGTWKLHWLNYPAKKSWPSVCSVRGCSGTPILGAHVTHTDVPGERIIPMCSSCNGLGGTFSLDVGVTPVKANKAETCG